MYRFHTTDKYLIDKDRFGNYCITRRQDSHSIYLQGDDANHFEDTIIGSTHDHQYDYVCSSYDEVMRPN